jgi:hypothetical protein
MVRYGFKREILLGSGGLRKRTTRRARTLSYLLNGKG